MEPMDGKRPILSDKRQNVARKSTLGQSALVNGEELGNIPSGGIGTRNGQRKELKD
jgi:hypothetical protein